MLFVRGPLVMTKRFGTFVRCTSASSGLSRNTVFSRNKSLRPQLLGRLKTSFKRGFLISASISRTLCPISANASPRLLTTVVFPSARDALLIKITRGEMPFSPEIKIEVRTLLNDSAIIDDLSCHTVISTVPGTFPGFAVLAWGSIVNVAEVL